MTRIIPYTAFCTLVAAVAAVAAAQAPVLNVPSGAHASRAGIVVARRDTLLVGKTKLLGVDVLDALGASTEKEVKMVNANDESDLGTWVGSTVAYNFATSGDAAEKMSVAGQIVLNQWHSKFLDSHGFALRVPIVGNLAKPGSGKDAADQLRSKADELMASSSGIYAGLQPYWEFKKTENGYATRVFGSALVRSNTLKDIATDSTFTMTQFRASGGLSGSIVEFRDGAGAYSVEFGYTKFRKGDYARAFGDDRSSMISTDAVLILPIAANVGILGQYLMNHTEGHSMWRLGLALRPNG
jgi:hypothetical protein